MPRVAKLNGESPATQPREGELAGDYRARLAEELGVRPECVGLLAGRSAVTSRTELSGFGEEEVLQVVVCPPNETISGWTVRMLLNELCAAGAKPDPSLADERLRAVEIRRPGELKNAIDIITSRALEQPGQFKECADVVVALNARWPELPPEEVEEGEKGEEGDEAKGAGAPKTFKGELFGALTRQWGTLRKSKPPEDASGEEEGAEEAAASHRRRALAMMSFLGQLFVRKVVDMNGLNGVALDLVGRDDKPPEDHQMACAVELLSVAGPCLDAMPSGRPSMSHWLDRIYEAASWSEENGLEIFSRPVLEKAEELITLRRRNWGKPLSGFA